MFESLFFKEFKILNCKQHKIYQKPHFINKTGLQNLFEVHRKDFCLQKQRKLGLKVPRSSLELLDLALIVHPLLFFLLDQLFNNQLPTTGGRILLRHLLNLGRRLRVRGK
jgi:hypothetical protein